MSMPVLKSEELRQIQAFDSTIDVLPNKRLQVYVVVQEIKRPIATHRDLVGCTGIDGPVTTKKLMFKLITSDGKRLEPLAGVVKALLLHYTRRNDEVSDAEFAELMKGPNDDLEAEGLSPMSGPGPRRAGVWSRPIHRKKQSEQEKEEAYVRLKASDPVFEEAEKDRAIWRDRKTFCMGHAS